MTSTNDVMGKIHWVKLISCIVLCQSAGLIGLIFTDASSGSWYSGLQKPSFNPPGWLFGPVWTLLYLLMAISLYLILQEPSSLERRKGLNLFYIQLFLNALWSFLFFGLNSPLLGLICILLLVTFILFTLIQFSRIHTLSGILFYPYLAWVLFATILNYSIYSLN